ncbi:tectonin beta-propeller repeat-containing protein [Hyalella azteca]|uniref:Tectonin beta-propeller repeat-containing protein n=1 Tax=Hyalella azteca TaxID=294128 RepID=A0A979FFM5_HYAAZ|nr:tectonin beta-propeller repeat-containing protein [Hyalella azteca]
MPSTQLFAVNNSGRVFTLLTDGKKWQELEYLGIEFKKVSAHELVVWALGGDHQIYVYVYGTTVPIRVSEEAYENQEPFIDISVGGGEVPGADLDALMVWGVTALGKVYYGFIYNRKMGPGRSGAVWAVAWDGSLLVRTGLSRDHPRGTAWVTVESPSGCPLQSVAVGVRAVWGCGRDHSVWFRRDVASPQYGPTGSSWLDMAGQRLLDISVGPEDQVWGVTSGEYNVVGRYGVVPSELTGQTWRVVDLPVVVYDADASRHHPQDDSSEESETPVDMTPLACCIEGQDESNSLDSLHRTMTAELCERWEPQEEATEGYQEAGDMDEMASSVALVSLSSSNIVKSDATLPASEKNNVLNSSDVVASSADAVSDEIFESASDGSGSDDPEDDVYLSTKDLLDGACASKSLTKRKKKTKNRKKIANETSAKTSVILSKQTTNDTTSQVSVPCINSSVSINPTVSPANWHVSRTSHENPVDSTVQMNPSSPLHLTPQSRSRHASSSSDSSHAALREASALGLRDAASSEAFPHLEEHLWLGVSGGGCWVSPAHWPDWFSGGGEGLHGVGWKENISYQLYQLSCQLQPFRGKYREVVHSGSWTVTGRCRWLTGGHWYPATLYLTIPDTSSASRDPAHPSEEEEEEAGNAEGDETNDDTEASSKSSTKNSSFEPVLVVEFSSNYKKKFSISMGSILAMRVHVLPPSRCLIALYCTPQPHEPCCLQFNSEHTAEEWADYLATAMWQLRQTLVTDQKNVTEDTINQNKLPETSVSLKSGVNSMHSSSLRKSMNCETLEKGSQGRQSMSSGDSLRVKWANDKRSAELIHKASDRTVWATTADGAVYLHDSLAQPIKQCCAAAAAEHRLVLPPRSSDTLVLPLAGGFTEGCSVALTLTVDPDAVRFHVNLAVSSAGYCTVALHVNPRISKKVVVLNSFECGEWQEEERHKLPGFLPSSRNTLTIVCAADTYQLLVNGRSWHAFKHRIAASSVTHVHVGGDVTVTSATYAHERPSLSLDECVWEAVGGHMVAVAGGAGGVVWALANDCHAYAYTGGRGGGPYKTLGSLTSPGLVHPMSDVVHDYLWENQRWNPVTGFSVRGLPTDRPTWTRYSRPAEPRTREEVRLPSTHWVWMSEWAVDYHPPGGCDSEGWQHATDFPLSFHSHCYVTDLVRRRRWKRKRRLVTSGPWQQLGRTLLVHVDIASRAASDGTIPVWGVSLSGEMLYRAGVTPQCPEGTAWTMIATDHPVSHVCVDMGPCVSGEDGGTPDDTSPATVIRDGKNEGHSRSLVANLCQVWGVAKDGRALLRLGVTPTNPMGIQWVDVDAPGVPLKAVQVGAGAVWGLDQQGSLYRRARTQPLFPEGTSWTYVCGGVEEISVAANGELWAVVTLTRAAEDNAKEKTSSGASGKGVGMLCRRVGVTTATPLGDSWAFAAGAGWGGVSAKMMCSAQFNKGSEETDEFLN